MPKRKLPTNTQFNVAYNGDEWVATVAVNDGKGFPDFTWKGKGATPAGAMMALQGLIAKLSPDA